MSNSDHIKEYFDNVSIEDFRDVIQLRDDSSLSDDEISLVLTILEGVSDTLTFSEDFASRLIQVRIKLISMLGDQ